MTEDRRIAPRHNAYLGAELDLGEGPVRSAITHDGSATGLLLLTRATLEVGQNLSIRCFVKEGHVITVPGKVVRHEALGPEENSLWRSKVAIVMEAPHPELAEHIAAVAERQAQTYGKEG